MKKYFVCLVVVFSSGLYSKPIDTTLAECSLFHGSLQDFASPFSLLDDNNEAEGVFDSIADALPSITLPSVTFPPVTVSYEAFPSVASSIASSIIMRSLGFSKTSSFLVTFLGIITALNTIEKTAPHHSSVDN